MKKSILASLVAIMVALIVAIPVMASYTGDITLVESNGTDYTMIGVSADINNTLLAAGNYITPTGLDTDVSNSGGTDLPHMLTTDKVWFATPITGNTGSSFTYEMGNAPASSFEIITGYDGYITTNDDAALEPTNSFTAEVSGYFDTSYSGTPRYILNKGNDLQLYVSADSQITASISNLAGASSQISYTTAPNDAFLVYTTHWVGQTFTTTSSFNISKVALQLSKIGSPPAGTVTLDLYATTGGVISGISLASSTITVASVTGNAWYDFTMGYTLLASTQYALVLHCNSGDSSNCVTWRFVNGSSFNGGVSTISTDSGGTWTDQITFDNSFNIYGYVNKTVVGAVSAGTHIIKVVADGTNLKLYDGATELDSVALSGASVTGNANNFIWLDDNTVPYANYIKYSKPYNTLLITYQPVAMISGTTLPDTTGTAQNGIITFGTNPAGIAVTVGALSAGDTEYTAPVNTTAAPNVVPGGNQTMTGTANVASSPFYPLFAAIETASGGDLTANLQAMMVAMIFGLGGAILGGIASKGQSFFLVVLGLGLGAGAGYAMKFYQDTWVLYVIGLLAIMSLVIDAKKSW